MTAPVLSLSQWSEAALSWGFEVAVKALVCGLLVYLVHLAVGRRRVLVRSALWNAALIGLLILPVAVACSPRWKLAVWPAPQPIETHTLIAAFDEAARSSAVIISTEPIPAVIQPANHLPLVVCGLYLLGLCGCLARFARALFGVARLRKNSTPVESACWQERLEHWRRQLGLPMPVGLRQSDEVSVPLMMGLRSPVVLIPGTLATITDRQSIDAVLLHELAHVGRSDYGWNLLLKLVQALYWFHPVGWGAGRILHQVREDACDAVCIHWLGGSREYVGVLVELVVSYVPRPAAALGLGVTRTSRLSRRLRRMANGPGNARFALGRRMRSFGIVAVTLAVLALASLRLSQRAAADEQAGVPSRDSKTASENQPGTPKSQPDDDSEDALDVTVKHQAEEDVRPRAREALDAAAEKTGQKVRVVKVRSGKVQDTSNLVCSLAGYEPLRVYSRLSGVVSKVAGNPGDVVKKGDTLAWIDVPDAEAQIAKAKAGVVRALAQVSTAQVQLEAAQAAIDAARALADETLADAERAKSSVAYQQRQYERMQNLLKSMAVDPSSLDESEEKLNGAKADLKAALAKISASKARLAQAEAEAKVRVAFVEAAEIDVAAAKEAFTVASMATLEENRVVRAPADGVIAERDADVGEAVGPDRKALFVLNSSSIIAARVNIPGKLVLKVKKGMSAAVTLDAQPTVQHAGKVTQVGYVIDPRTATFPATIAIPNSEGNLRPGMAGAALIVLSETELPVIPSSAVAQVTQGGVRSTFCYKWVDGHFEKVPVRLHSDDGQQAAIAEGLAVDDEVALDAPARWEADKERAKKGERGALAP